MHRQVTGESGGGPSTIVVWNSHESSWDRARSGMCVEDNEVSVVDWRGNRFQGKILVSGETEDRTIEGKRDGECTVRC